jgi:hypothetical protein
MNYTSKIKQAQYVGGIKILPCGGRLSQEEINAIKADPWGKELLQKKVLVIDGLRPEDYKDEPKKKRGPKRGQAKLQDEVKPEKPDSSEQGGEEIRIE